jgi:hypothetical protein
MEENHLKIKNKSLSDFIKNSSLKDKVIIHEVSEESNRRITKVKALFCFTT